MSELNTLVGDELSVLSYIIFFEIKYIHWTKLSITLLYHSLK